MANVINTIEDKLNNIYREYIDNYTTAKDNLEKIKENIIVFNNELASYPAELSENSTITSSYIIDKINSLNNITDKLALVITSINTFIDNIKRIDSDNIINTNKLKEISNNANNIKTEIVNYVNNLDVSQTIDNQFINNIITPKVRQLDTELTNIPIISGGKSKRRSNKKR